MMPTVISEYSGSRECLARAKQWLEICERDHPDCRRTDEHNSQLPSRVLRVGNDTVDPSLYVTKGATGRWVALSYCWGGETEFKLQESMYIHLAEGCPLEDFPATMRDAILITRALGFEYLWIDALCIRQDFHDDWKAEAPKMSEIYTKAALTIVNGGRHAKSVNTGIFKARNSFGSALRYDEPSYSLPWKGDNTQQDFVADERNDRDAERVIIASPTFSQDDWVGPPAGSSWASRGWTLQEDLLSWRTLTFMEHSMLWGCSSVQVWETGQLRLQAGEFGLPRDAQIVQRVRPNLGYFPTSAAPPIYTSSLTGVRELTLSEIYAAWYTMLEDYTERKLTKDSDILMAIAGIAKDVQGYLPDRYCAGLWENDIVAGLIWRTNGASWKCMNWQPKKGEDDSRGWQVQSNSNPNIPSWTWASVNNALEWPFKRVTVAMTGPHANAHDAEGYAHADYFELAAAEDFRIMRGELDNHGTRISGDITLRAPSFSWTAADEGSETLPEVCNRILEILKWDVEYHSSRHKTHPGQLFLAQQLARLERKDSVSHNLTWALLILETPYETTLTDTIH